MDGSVSSGSSSFSPGRFLNWSQQCSRLSAHPPGTPDVRTAFWMSVILVSVEQKLDIFLKSN